MVSSWPWAQTSTAKNSPKVPQPLAWVLNLTYKHVQKLLLCQTNEIWTQTNRWLPKIFQSNVPPYLFYCSYLFTISLNKIITSLITIFIRRDTERERKVRDPSTREITNITNIPRSQRDRTWDSWLWILKSVWYLFILEKLKAREKKIFQKCLNQNLEMWWVVGFSDPTVLR